MRDAVNHPNPPPRLCRFPHASLLASLLILTAMAAFGVAAEPETAPAESASVAVDLTTVGATPAGVVEAQMTALSEWHTDPDAAARVFRLASPANKAVTGPLPRFRQMVEAPPYSALLSNDGWSAGKPVQTESVAAVLVTLIDEDGDLLAFRFYLSKQPPTKGSVWMTDAVIALPLPTPPAAAAPPTSI